MESLVVASKIKAKIREKSNMNTSAEVIDELTKHVDKLLDLAFHSAAQDDRKTVMARDIVKFTNYLGVNNERK